ncbi:MAG: hypothetical protein K0Q73_8673, partial [Paenibacillus sp.]|nr:hypothetical protein [Paenibacillus sp.]
MNTNKSKKEIGVVVCLSLLGFAVWI